MQLVFRKKIIILEVQNIINGIVFTRMTKSVLHIRLQYLSKIRLEDR